MKPSTDFVVCPFRVCIDSREKAPFSFIGIKSDAKHGNVPMVIPTVGRTLRSGDYAIDGYDDLIAVERKSLEDCYQTLSHERERFERELDRLNFMQFAAVVIEASWVRILTDPPPHSKLSPKSVSRSIIAYMQRFPRVHWIPATDRRFAEVITFRVLERFWKDRLDSAKAGQNKSKPIALEGNHATPGA